MFLRVSLLKVIVVCRILRFNKDCWFPLLAGDIKKNKL